MRVDLRLLMIVILTALFPHTAAAQKYPTGACVLPSGQWCIPPNRDVPGSECSCLTDDGWKIGTQN